MGYQAASRRRSKARMRRRTFLAGIGRARSLGSLRPMKPIAFEVSAL